MLILNIKGLISMIEKEFSKIQKNINNTIKTTREKHEYTVRDLAAMTNISYAYLSRLENNKINTPSLYTYLKLFEVLELSPANIFKEIESMPPFSDQYLD